ncbi:MAG: oxygen-independent coproporphyrinogen III oxidase [bacterium]|nr:oxygen-independent coproporphyrinogen III oxidase [bacterium]
MLEQLQRYSRPVPRYTSYPTAPVFREDFAAEDYASLLGRPDRGRRPLSLYFHFPFCRNICFFCACTVIYTANKKRMAPYMRLLVREMDLVLEALAARGEGEARDDDGRLFQAVSQLHFGGGTPGFASPDEIRGFHREITKRFRFAPDAELSVELDPRETTDEHIAAYAGCGFNRASLGVQDLDPKVQRAVNRVQPFDELEILLTKLREAGFRGINLDLIYGLPHQTPEGFAQTIDGVLSLQPDRLSLFQFAYLPQLKQHQQRINAEALPEVRTRLEILSNSIEQLTRAGYVYIGMDHFARPDDPMAIAASRGELERNFQGYTVPPGMHSDASDDAARERGSASAAYEQGSDLLAFGVSAIGDLGDAYVQNTRHLKTYESEVLAGRLPVDRGLVLNADDHERRRIIMLLICRFELEYDSGFRARYAPEFEVLAGFHAEGLVEIEEPSFSKTANRPGRLRVTEAGKFVIRNICQVFDAYTRELAARGQQFSKSV